MQYMHLIVQPKGIPGSYLVQSLTSTAAWQSQSFAQTRSERQLLFNSRWGYGDNDNEIQLSSDCAPRFIQEFVALSFLAHLLFFFSDIQCVVKTFTDHSILSASPSFWTKVALHYRAWAEDSYMPEEHVVQTLSRLYKMLMLNPGDDTPVVGLDVDI